MFEKVYIYERPLDGDTLIVKIAQDEDKLILVEKAEIYLCFENFNVL